MARSPMTDEASKPSDHAFKPMRTQGFLIYQPSQASLTPRGHLRSSWSDAQKDRKSRHGAASAASRRGLHTISDGTAHAWNGCRSAVHQWRGKMLNPWLSLSCQTARLGWETQSAVVDQMMRIASAGISDRKAADASDRNVRATPAEVSEASVSPVQGVEPAKRCKHH
jgi:hypothetical protein